MTTKQRQLLKQPALVAILATSVAAVLMAPHILSWLPLAFGAVGWLVHHKELRASMAASDQVPLAAALVFVSWSLVTAFYAPERGYAIATVFGAFANLVGAYTGILFARSLRPISAKTAMGLVAGHMALAAVLLAVLTKELSFEAIRGARTTIIHGDFWAYNRAALMAVLLVPVSALALTSLSLSRFAQLAGCAAVVAVTTAVVFLSDSESAKFGLLFVIGAGLFGIVAGTAATPIVAGGLIAALFVVPVTIGVWSSHLTEIWPNLLARVSANARLEIWTALWGTIRRSPLLGYGVEFMRATELSHPATGASVTNSHPHSMIFQLWSDLGLVGVILFAVFLGAIAANVRNDPPLIRACRLALIAGTFAIASVSHGMWQHWWLGMLSLMVMFLCAGINERPADAPLQHMTDSAGMIGMGPMGRQFQKRWGAPAPAAAARVAGLAAACVAALLSAYVLRLGFRDGLRPALIGAGPMILSAGLAMAWTGRGLVALPVMDETTFPKWFAFAAITAIVWAFVMFLLGSGALLPRSVPFLFAWVLVTIVAGWNLIMRNRWPHLAV